MKKTKKLVQKSTSVNFRENFVESEQEVKDVGADSSEYFCDIYRELAELIGEKETRKVWKHYAGLSVDFPQRLYSKEYIKRIISDNMDVKKPREIARMVNLSERRVRQIIQELKEKNREKVE